ncbi:MAG: solute carrier family 26 protein [Snowella sp.]|nr:solute carrier family 26 protein [Snowella sp.]
MKIKPFLTYLTSFLPGIHLLRAYQSVWLRNDGLAGITVAAYLIPQCMAYGELAGVQPVVGLWGILPSMLIYALFGSSLQLSVGPESTTAVMTAVAIAPLVARNNASYPLYTSLLAVLVGIICLMGYWARLGFLADLLSKPILVGYMAGVALIMISGQLDKISGIKIESETVLGEFQGFFHGFDHIHWLTFGMGIGVLTFLLLVQHYFPNAPAPLLAVLLATMIVAIFHLERYGVVIVGEIPSGLPDFVSFQGITFKNITSLLGAALGIAIVGYSDNVLTGRAFAINHGHKINANQELLALGFCNLATGFLQGFPVSSSGSRTAIADSLGSKTQVYSLVAGFCVLLVLLFLRPLLALFPKAALGGIVIYAALKLIRLSEFRRLQSFKRSEFMLAVITTVGVLGTDILRGVAIAVALSGMELFARVARPHAGVLGEVPNLPGFHTINDWQDAKTIPGLVLYRYDAPLFFANAENFKNRALQAIASETDPVQWFILNTEAIIEIDITAADILEELRQELAKKGIIFGLAKVKQELYAQLRKSGLVDRLGPDHIYLTIHEAIAAFETRNDLH